MLHLAEKSSVRELTRQLAEYSDVQPADAILLCGPPFVRMEPRRRLSYYRTELEKDLFLFCKASLDKRSQAPADTVL